MEDDVTIDLMDWLVESSPQGTEIILAGRDLPAIGAVDWRIAGGEAVVFGSSDLAFSEAEVGTLCERSGHQAPELSQATGGWPVAVMAICSGTIAYGSSKKKPQDAAWARYLGAQVLAAVPEHLQEALLRLAPLPVMDSWQAEERIGRTAWVELAAWLRAHDFLYEALDGGRFRLNPMVRTFLCDEYQRREPAAFDSTLGDLIETLAHEGRTSEAIELARRDGQERRLADVLEGSAQELLHRGAFAQLWRGFESMPASLLETRPVLAGVRTRVLVHLGRPQDALEEADRLLADPSFTGAARVHAVLAKMRRSGSSVNTTKWSKCRTGCAPSRIVVATVPCLPSLRTRKLMSPSP